ELAKGMGQAVREFQKAKDEFNDELHKAGKTEVAAQPPVSTVPTTPRLENPPSEPVVRPESSQTTDSASKV
ncbi:MAG: hypothetical protein ACXV97_10975, partial [Chthoniobacterales bacterium]